MKKRRFVAWIIIVLFLITGCAPPSLPPTDTPPDRTSTPTFPGTFKMNLHGEVYDGTTSQPIEGATVRYLVVHTSFPEVHIGEQDEALTDDQGEYTLSIIVHDMDNINIIVEAPGYQTFEQKLDPIGGRRIDVGLTPASP